MKLPNAIEVGRLTTTDKDNVKDESQASIIEYGLLIKCDSLEQIRDAMKTGKIEFTVFGETP